MGLMKGMTDSDLSQMFGIDLDMGVAADATKVLCKKCNGRGNFIGRNGKVIGQCFTCNGSGLDAAAGRKLNPGDCEKCMGSGEWRPGKPCFACNGTGKPPVAAAIDVSAITASFEAARANGIKAPKLRLGDFTFSRAPDAGKNAGSIYVKADGEYLGKVTGDKFVASMACDDPTKAQVIEVASDPMGAAKAYGMKTGSCSCCGRELTNAESIELGIGPICIGKFGWG